MEDQNVIVAGAGPVGLVAALALGLAGVRVQVFEKRQGISEASKASTFHPPTLAILDRLGVFDRMQQEAHRVSAVQYRSPEAVIGSLSYSLLEGLTSHPFRMHYEQSMLTRLLLARLQTLEHVSVNFDHEVVDVHNRADGVTAVLRHGATSRSAEGRFLIAADGSRSGLRSALGIAFEGESYPGKVLRIRTDESIEALLPGLASLTYLVGPTHSASFLRMPDCWRLILRVRAGIDDDECMSPQWIHQQLAPLIPGLAELPRVIGMDTFATGKFVASKAYEGNVFLAGDCAHITSTRGGMNMNCGIHDAYVLARAAVQALKGGDPAPLRQAAESRTRMARDCLIPRTDTMVSATGTWIDRVGRLLHDAEQGRAYLRESAMLDMVDLQAT